MKKILKSKRFVIVLAIVIIALAVAGSYSWFTKEADAALSSTMGKLSIDVTAVDNMADDYYYEPGEDISMTYTFSNIHNDPGYLCALIQVDLENGTVTYYYDEDGEPLATPVTEAIDPSIFNSATCKIKSVIEEEDPYRCALWYVDRTTGLYYLLIDPGMDATADFDIALDGSAMGNEYQGAVFNFLGSFKYTQVLEAAALDVFGLDFANLDPIDADGNVLTINLYRSGLRSFYMSQLYDRAG